MENNLDPLANTKTIPPFVFVVLRWVNNYAIANFQTPAVIISLTFLVIADINFLKGDVSFLFSPQFATILKMLGVASFGHLNQASLMGAFFRLSFVVFIFNTVLRWLVQVLFKKNISIALVSILQGVVLISALAITALFSCYAPQAAINATILIPIIVITWIGALASFSFAIFWEYGSERVFNLLQHSIRYTVTQP